MGGREKTTFSPLSTAGKCGEPENTTHHKNKHFPRRRLGGGSFVLWGGRDDVRKNIIVATAANYKEKLEDKHFLIIYQSEKGIQYIQAGFRSSHFLHMTGAETKLTAQRFYERCIDGKLAAGDFELDSKGNAQRNWKCFLMSRNFYTITV